MSNCYTKEETDVIIKNIIIAYNNCASLKEIHILRVDDEKADKAFGETHGRCFSGEDWARYVNTKIYYSTKRAAELGDESAKYKIANNYFVFAEDVVRFTGART